MGKDNLLTEIRNGNRAAFDELCREELPVLLSYARAFLYDKWADDVVQDVLFSFWKNRESLKSDCAVRRYLLRSSLSDEKSMLVIALLPYLTNAVSGIL